MNYIEQPLWYSEACNYIISNINQSRRYLGVIFGTHTACHSVAPSDHVVRTATALFDLLKTRGNNTKLHPSGKTEAELRFYSESLLKDCSDVESLVRVTDLENGYNIFLSAVLKQDKQVMTLLFEAGCNFNLRNCTLPLHLACKLGYYEIVVYLICNGAQSDVESGMCYPKPHQPIRHVPSRFHFMETDVFLCDTDHRIPLMYAIEGDHVEIVNYLLSISGSAPANKFPLHHACIFGAYNCIQYLLEMYPEIVNVHDEGMTPILHGILWGYEITKLLIQANASIHATNSKMQNSLHLLFLYLRKPHELYKTVKLLISAGMEQYVCNKDHMRRTPLDILVALLSRNVASFEGYSVCKESDITKDQDDFDQQVLAAIQLLLVNNCNPNTVDNKGLNSMHKVLLQLECLLNMEEENSSFRNYRVDTSVFIKSIEILLYHGADPNHCTAAGRLPLEILLHILLNTRTSLLVIHISHIIKCIGILCKMGASPSLTDSIHIELTGLLMNIALRILLIRDDTQKIFLSKSYKTLLHIMLKHGLKTNYCNLTPYSSSTNGNSGNILLEIACLAQCVQNSSDLFLIYDWILTLLQNGVNPDIEPYPSDSIVCHSQSSIFLMTKGSQALNHIIYKIPDNDSIKQETVSKILMLFYNSMGHIALYQCMATAKFMSKFNPNQAPPPSILEIIFKVSSKPRTLKRIARVAIYNALDRQLTEKVKDLPLPAIMKQYISDIS